MPVQDGGQELERLLAGEGDEQGRPGAEAVADGGDEPGPSASW
ncbi:hypothetical protein ACGFMK_25985 [Amycolatopsis sp. NPDC049252]